jgi:hypothetical protein
MPMTIMPAMASRMAGMTPELPSSSVGCLTLVPRTGYVPVSAPGSDAARRFARNAPFVLSITNGRAAPILPQALRAAG